MRATEPPRIRRRPNSSLIDKYFEEDMLNRKQELAAIEARLAKLPAQLDRRREKKDDIVNLQYQVAVNEAEGLGLRARQGQSIQHSRRGAGTRVTGE